VLPSKCEVQINHLCKKAEIGQAIATQHPAYPCFSGVVGGTPEVGALAVAWGCGVSEWVGGKTAALALSGHFDERRHGIDKRHHQVD
jgi:hypothetical protein